MLILSTLLLPVLAAGQTRAQRYLDSLMRTEPFRSAQMGVLAVKVGGDTVAQWGRLHKMEPASNTKLITTGLALACLGPEYRFQTSIAIDGTVSEGVLHGDVYILGGGDPTLASRDSIASGIDGVFAKWKKMLTAAGIKRIDGNVLGDGRWLDGERELPSWLYEDIGTYYGTGGGGLSFYRNKLDFKVSAGAKTGDPIHIGPVYPDTPWMTFRYRCTTGKAGTGDQLYLYTSDLAPIGEMRGTFAVDKGPKTVECSNKFAAFTCAHEFYKYLKSSGLPVKGYGDIDDFGHIRLDLGGSTAPARAASPQEGLTVLGITRSPQLRRIAYLVNQRSDNFYAESLLRTLGKERRGSACYDSCYVAQREAFRSLGVDPSYGVSLYDGSGLSRKNAVSADFFCRFLRALMDQPVFEAFAGTLSQPGVGSQAGRLRSEPQTVRSRIWYKSGSMEGVRCYTGFVTPTDGGKEDTIIFSVLLNSYSGPNWMAMSRLDKLIALIAAEN